MVSNRVPAFLVISLLIAASFPADAQSQPVVGCGRTITADDGSYEFLTVRPGAYPWPNRVNDWRPMHIHLSLFGSGFGQRLITQLYFEGDPLIARCPIVHTIGQEKAIQSLIAPLDMNRAIPMDCLAYRFDVVLRGRRQTVFENRMEGM